MPTKARSTAAPLNEDAIRHRAYLMWEADGRPDGMADHYWMKASEPAPDVSARPKARATVAKASAPAVKARPAAKAPAKKA